MLLKNVVNILFIKLFIVLQELLGLYNFPNGNMIVSTCAGLQTKKSSKEPLAPIREKLRRQIIFLGAAE